MEIDVNIDKKKLFKYGVSKEKFYVFLRRLNIKLLMNEAKILYGYISDNQLITMDNILMFTNLNDVNYILQLPVQLSYIHLLNIKPIRINCIY